MNAAEISDLPASAFEAPATDGDTTLVKSTRPTTCAVCRQVVTASIVLPEEVSVCQGCTCIALRHMIVDAEVCRGGGSGAFRARGGRL